MRCPYAGGLLRNWEFGARRASSRHVSSHMYGHSDAKRTGYTGCTGCCFCPKATPISYLAGHGEDSCGPDLKWKYSKCVHARRTIVDPGSALTLSRSPTGLSKHIYGECCRTVTCAVNQIIKLFYCKISTLSLNPTNAVPIVKHLSRRTIELPQMAQFFLHGMLLVVGGF